MSVINKVVYGEPALRVPSHLSFSQVVIDKLKENCKDGVQVALINADTGHKLTYQQILQGAVSAAEGLRRLGVRRGHVVALCSENRPEFMLAALGAVCCGATVTTLNLMYTKDELVNALDISRPTVLIGSEVALQRNLTIFQSVSCLKHIIQLNGSPLATNVLSSSDLMVPADVNQFEPTDVQSSDNVFILYSSGTTGLPKGVMISHINMLNSIAGFEQKTHDERLVELSIMPWYHAYGLQTSIGSILVGQLFIYFSAGFNPEKYLKAIQEYKVTYLATVPPIVVFLAKAPVVEKFDLSSVKWVWCGAAPLSAETINAVLKRMPNCQGVYQAYGMTETTLVATKDIDDNSKPHKAGSAGYAGPGIRIKVVDIDTRQKLGPKEKGEICLKGPNLMKGYAGNEAASRDVIDEEGYLKTGDVGYYDEDGCLFIVDRLKELIKYKGNQVAPAAVESVLLQHSSVAECGVVGAPDEVAGELPTAFVVVKPGAKLTERELLDFTDAKLSTSSRLHGGVIFVKEIPKNASGKKLRRLLKDKLQKVKKSKL